MPLLPSSEILTSSLFSWEDESGQTQTLDVDVVMAAVDRRTAKMTDHVVEDGSVITDHVVVMPESISLDLTVTQTPIGPAGMVKGPISISWETNDLVRASYPLKVEPSRFVPGGFLALSSPLRSAVTEAGNALLRTVGLGGPASPNGYAGHALQKGVKSGQAQVHQVIEQGDLVSRAHDKLVGILDRKLPVSVSFKGRLYLNYILTEVTLTQAAGCGRFHVEARALRVVQGTPVQLPNPADFRAQKQQQKGGKGGTTPDPDPTKQATSDWLRLSEGAGDFFSKAFFGSGATP